MARTVLKADGHLHELAKGADRYSELTLEDSRPEALVQIASQVYYGERPFRIIIEGVREVSDATDRGNVVRGITGGRYGSCFKQN